MHAYNGILLHNEELRNLCASPSIIRVIKSRKMRWNEHVAHVGGMRNACKTLVRKPERKSHAEDLGVDGKVILESILGK
jgi:hypothetical protein